jgi:hypothetical protein
MLESLTTFEILNRRFDSGNLPFVDGKIFRKGLLREQGRAAPCGMRQSVQAPLIGLSDPDCQSGWRQDSSPWRASHLAADFILSHLQDRVEIEIRARRVLADPHRLVVGKMIGRDR